MDTQGTQVGRASVRITTKPLWRIRLPRELLAIPVYALALAGLAASARFAIAPPHPAALAASLRAPSPPDRAAEGYASLFARRYLTWDAAEPQASQRALASFVGPGMEPDAGLQLPPSGEQRVEWVEVVQERESTANGHIYTVAVADRQRGPAVPDRECGPRGETAALRWRATRRSWERRPPVPAQAPAHAREVDDPALATVVERALRNYLAAASGELAADLAGGAHVSLPGLALSLESVQRLDWSPGEVRCSRSCGPRTNERVQYTLAYELDVAREEGRWEVSAVQMDPDA